MAATLPPENEPTKRWILVGAGYVHLLALKRVAELQNFPLEITLISEFETTPFHSMMPEFIGGFYKADEIRIPALPMVEKAKAKFICDTVTGFDFESQKVLLKSGGKVPYDFVSFNCGVKPNTKGIKGAEKFAHLSRPARAYQKSILEFCDSLRGKRKVTLVQLGTDYQGAENILSLVRRLKTYGAETKVHIIEAGSKILPQGPRKASHEMTKMLEALKGQIHFESGLTEVTEKDVVLKDGTRIPSDFTSISLAPELAPWLSKQGFDTFSKLIKINQHLETSKKNVFAVGEIAIDPERPWTQTYKASSRQAKVLVANVKAKSLGLPLKKFRPARISTQLLTNGDGQALLSRGGLGFSFSDFLWNWKAKNDKKFLEIFKSKPPTSEASSESTLEPLGSQKLHG